MAGQTQADHDPATPRVVVLESGDAAVDAIVAERASDLADARVTHVPPGGTADPSAFDGATTVVAIGHGVAADHLLALLGNAPVRWSHAIVLHPVLAADTSALGTITGIDMLVTAGATDAATPPDRVGALIDALDAGGATTRIVWTRGGPDITDEEQQQITAFFNDISARLVDPSTLPVQLIDEGAKGRYIVEAPGNAVAEMTYSRANDGLIIIDHTEVPEAFRGSGTGLRLLKALIADARSEAVRIIPLCPFAAAQFKRHPEWSDVLETKVRVKTQALR